jgi:hypothetical protein
VIKHALTCSNPLAWTLEASSHFEAMTAYYRYRGQGTYTTDFPDEGRHPYSDEGRYT